MAAEGGFFSGVVDGFLVMENTMTFLFFLFFFFFS